MIYKKQNIYEHGRRKKTKQGLSRTFALLNPVSLQKDTMFKQKAAHPFTKEEKHLSSEHTFLTMTFRRKDGAP